MQFMGYGEDALTLRTLKERMPEILKQLRDDSDPDSVIVLFRPSFGRRSGSEGRRAAPFGEFDAIIATDLAVYLVEAKWSRSPEVRNKKAIVLRGEQNERHKVLRWYLERWRQFAPTTWKAFRTAVMGAFERTFGHLKVPFEGQDLAINLEYVLKLLAARGDQIVDVLLYIEVKPKSPTAVALPPHSTFRLVTILFNDIDDSGFFPLK